MFKCIGASMLDAVCTGLVANKLVNVHKVLASIIVFVLP